MAKPNPEIAVLTPHHVLVIEDDALIATHISETLADRGYVTALAVSIADGEQLLSERAFHAVTLDYRVGAQDSLAFARSLEVRGVPYLFCTGSLREEVQQALNSDVAVVTKPFLDEDLLAAVAGVIARARPSA
jgi:CheY-like chemotaxis protein